MPAPLLPYPMTGLSSSSPPSRLLSIDALRGLVMLIMLLDHVRETVYLHAQVSDPMDVANTPPELFFSRALAHLCAPVFVFLTGLSAWLYGQKAGSLNATGGRRRGSRLPVGGRRGAAITGRERGA